MDLHLLLFIIFSQDVRNIWILILFSNQQWRLKGNSLTVGNDDLETTPNSDGSQLSKHSTGDEHLSMLMEQGKAMVALLQSSVDVQKKETEE